MQERGRSVCKNLSEKLGIDLSGKYCICRPLVSGTRSRSSSSLQHVRQERGIPCIHQEQFPGKHHGTTGAGNPAWRTATGETITGFVAIE